MNHSTPTRNCRETATLLGVPFTTCGSEALMASIAGRIAEKQKGYISITNTESLHIALNDPAHFDYICNADHSCCDGIAVRIAGKMLGVDIPRLHGPDLMLACCRHSVDKGWRHYFYGGKEGVPALLQARLEAQFPGMLTVGAYSPPFRPLTAQEDQAIVDNINASGADILWVGLGLPKQERWIAAHRGKIETPWMVGVGAAFDFHAGTIKRAPRFYQRMGLEWLYRLAFEPRMLVRNFNSLRIFNHIARELYARHTSRPKNRGNCI